MRGHRGPNRVSACSPGPCASFKWIVAAPPCLSHELCSLLLVHLVEDVSRERGVIEVQIGYQRVRQVHAHLLRGFRCSTMFI